MVTITPIPSATTSSSSEELLVLLNEGLCQAYSTSASIQPVSSVSFVAGTPTILTVAGTGSTADTYSAIVPIHVIGQITYVPKGKCSAITKLFAETFTVGFTGLTSSPTAFTITTGMQTTEPYNVKSCNRAYGYTINTAITVEAV